MIDKKTVQTYCMKNQLPELISLLKEKDTEDIYYTKFKERFIDREKIEYNISNPLLVAILHDYEEYYISVFYNKVPRNKAKKELRLRLCKTINIHKFTMLSMEKKIRKIFTHENINFNGHETSGYYGPYIWEKTEKVKYSIELPNGKVELPVLFMHGFIMNSWLDYISLGEIGTGGWSKKEGLYCIYDKYKEKLDKPDFKISYLTHEAQHNIDMENKKYNMSTSLLEYRAKLAELVYYPDLKLFEKFLTNAKNDKRLSHPQAQYWIVSDLSKLIFNQDYVDNIKEWESRISDIQEQSRKLLLDYNRCKPNWVLGTLSYYVRALFI